jgi:hypothetical protein
MLALNVATKCVHEKQSHKMNPSRGARWENLQQMFLVGFSTLVNSKCAKKNDTVKKEIIKRERASAQQRWHTPQRKG